MKIYVASSWRNLDQPDVVSALRLEGHEVYDFRHPRPDHAGLEFNKMGISGEPIYPDLVQVALNSQHAQEVYDMDFNGMIWADACVLVLPAGISAHLEAGWFMGNGKPVIAFSEEKIKPELMYKLAEPKLGLYSHMIDVLQHLKRLG